MQIFLASWLTDRSLGDSLTKMKASKRLLSYFFLGVQGIGQRGFTEYIKTGCFDPRKKK